MNMSSFLPQSTILFDGYEKNPVANFDKYADAISNIIVNNDYHNFCIGIISPWGTGKTTLMKIIESKIKRHYNKEICWNSLNENTEESNYLKNYLREKFEINKFGKTQRISDNEITIESNSTKIFKTKTLIIAKLTNDKTNMIIKDNNEFIEKFEVEKCDDELKIILPDIDKEIHTIWFNAWQYEREEEFALIPLLKTIAYSLPKHKKLNGLRRALKEAGITLSKNSGEIFSSIISKYLGEGVGNITGEFLKKFTSEYVNRLETIEIIDKKTIYSDVMKKIEDEMDEILKNDPHSRIVVFIDDMDRCSEDTVREVFESIKIFLGLKGFIYVLGISQDTISKFITRKPTSVEESHSRSLAENIGDQYIKKIIQIPYPLPEWNEDQIDSLIEILYPQLSNKEYAGIIQKHKKTIIRAIDKNPREIKRFINKFIIDYTINSTNPLLKPNEFLVIQALKYRWNIFYNFFTFERYRKLIQKLLDFTSANRQKILNATQIENLRETTYPPVQLSLIEDIKNFNSEFPDYKFTFNDNNLLWDFLIKEKQVLFGIQDWDVYGNVMSNKLLDLDNSIAELYSNAYTLFNLGRYSEALNFSDSILTKDPTYVNAWNLKGLIFDKSQKFDLAIQFYDKAIEIDPSFILGYYNKGLALQGLKKYNESINFFEKSLTIDPNYLSSIISIGYSYKMMKNYDLANKYFDETIKRDPSSNHAYLEKALILDEQKNYEEAIKLYDKILKNDSNHFIAHYNKALDLHDLAVQRNTPELFQQSLKLYDEVIQMDPNYVNAYYNKGRIFEFINDNQNAKKCYEKVLELYPDDMDARIALGRVA